MNNDIVVRLGQKALITSREHFIVTIGNFVCLRILGQGPKYAIVTATADEDNKLFRALRNQELLIEAARKTSEALGGAHLMCRDNYGREYVQICRIENQEDARRVIEVFDGFIPCIGNDNKQAESEARNELRELYDALAPDASGEDVYLQDGVWLGSGGKIKDSGR